MKGKALLHGVAEGGNFFEGFGLIIYSSSNPIWIFCPCYKTLHGICITGAATVPYFSPSWNYRRNYRTHYRGREKQKAYKVIHDVALL